MIDQELQTARRERWRLEGKAIRTIEQARAFIESVGFCLMYPQRPPLLAPTFMGAFVGTDAGIPDWQRAYSDPRAAEATELMVRLLREHAAYEANFSDENNGLLLAASVFPYFYALVGDRNPKQPPKAGARSPYSQLARDAFDVIQRDGPISKQKMREVLGGSVSFPALDKALGELWSKLRITRVDYKAGEGSFWDVLPRWAPDAVKEGVSLSVGEALSALLSKYLECVVAAEQTELENFFGNFVARSKIRDSVNALLAARELSFVHIGGKSMVQITPEKIPVVPAPRPLVRRPVVRRPAIRPSAARPSGRPRPK
jgi:Winged helix DNA-binding domain